MNLEGERVLLRAVEERDLPLLHRWANDPEIWSRLGSWHFPYGFESTKAWFEQVRSDSTNLRLVIETRADGQAIGTANLVDIDWKNRHATHGMMLGSPETRGKGYGGEVVRAVMRYAFDELGLERLDSDIIEGNEPSYRLYVGKCGWKEEGRLRRWHFRGGRFWDKILIGVTREDDAARAQTDAALPRA